MSDLAVLAGIVDSDSHLAKDETQIINKEILEWFREVLNEMGLESKYL